MRRVLICAYYFPPLGMGGTQRIAKFCKHLPEFGWRPTVVTVKTVAYYAFDFSSTRDVRSVQVIHTGSLDPQRLLYLLQKQNHKGNAFEINQSGSWLSRGTSFINKTVLPLFMLPDTKLLWLPFAYIRSRHLLEREKFDLLFTTSPPHSIHFLGLNLKKRFHMPWVADFRDRWVGGEFQREVSSGHRMLNARMQKSIVNQADHIIGVSDGLVRSLQKVTTKKPTCFSTITNGFDAEDFQIEPLAAEREEKVIFCHCGAITEISDPTYFLRGVQQAIMSQPELKYKIKILFVGHVLETKIYKTVEDLYLNDLVEFCGYVSHARAVAYLDSADVLILTLSEQVSSGFIPGKLFEYLGSEKSIIAIVPSGETCSILQRSGLARVCWPPDPHEISESIIRMVDSTLHVKLSPTEKEYIRGFERKVLTEKLAAVFDACVRGDRTHNSKR